MLKRIRRLILPAKKCVFYLAGPISNVQDDSYILWRDDITTFLESIGHEAANPLTKYAVPSGEKTKVQQLIRNSEKDEIVREYMRQRIIKHDLEMVEQSDAIIAYVPFYSSGTGAEIALAYYLGKSVYVVTTLPRETWVGWLVGLSTLIFTSWDDLKAFLRRWRY